MLALATAQAAAKAAGHSVILGSPPLPTPPVSDPQPPRSARAALADNGHSTDRPGRPERHDNRTFFERLVEFVSPGPDSKAELIRTLADAENREVIEPESRQMLEGVLRMADMTAGDVMVAAPRMDLLDIDVPTTTCWPL